MLTAHLRPHQAAALAIAIVAPACAADVLPTNPVDGDTPVEQQQRATIRGSVFLEGRTDHGGVRVSAEGLARTAFTAADGSFAIDELLAGSYTLTLDFDGFRSSSITGIDVQLGDSVINVPPVILETAKGSVRGEIAIDQTDVDGAGELAGVTMSLRSVTSEQGADIPAVSSALRPTQEDEPEPAETPEVYLQALTNERGAYVFPEAPVGSYLLVAQREGLASTCAGLVVVAEDNEVVEVSLLRLAPASAVLSLRDADGRIVTHTRENALNLQLLALNAVQMRIGQDPEGLAEDPYIELKASVPVVLDGDDGPRRFYAQFLDSCGLESPVYSAEVALDTTPPSGEVTLQRGSAYLRDPEGKATLGVSADDGANGCGVAEMRIGIDEAAGEEPTPIELGLPEPFVAEKEINLGETDARKAVAVSFVDCVGNASEPARTTIIKDSSAPAIVTLEADGPGDGRVYTRQVRVTVEAEGEPTWLAVAEGTGVADDAPRRSFEPEVIWLLPDADGEYTLAFRLWDAAGNSSETATLTLLLDRTSDVSGVVRLEGRAPGEHAGTSVTLSAVSGAVQTDADGRFTFAGVPPGLQSMQAEHPGYVTVVLPSLTVVPGQGTFVPEVVLFRARGSVAGVARRADGTDENDHGGSRITALAPGGELRTTFTAPDGRYRVDNLETGDWTVVASSDGYLDDSAAATVIAGGVTDVPELRLEIEPGTLEGTVTWEGSDAPEITVTLAAPGVASQQADESGAYVFENLREGSYAITASAPGYGDARGVAFVSAGATVLAPPLTLSILRDTLQGAVFLADGATPAGIRVELSGTATVGENVGRTTFTDSSGNFELLALPHGTDYRLSAAREGYRAGSLEAIAVPRTNPAELTLAVEPGSVAGQVRIEAQPDLAGIVVSLSGTSLSGVAVQESTVTDSEGRYALSDLPGGRYSVEFAAGGFDVLREDVALAPGEARVLDDVVLQVARGDLEGRVVRRLEDGSAGTGIAEVLVRLQGSPYSTFTDGAGGYALRDVPVGAYTLEATRQGFKPVDHTRAVTVAADQATEVETIALESNPGSIEGNVRYDLEGGITNPTCDDGLGHAGIEIIVPGEALSATTNCDGRFVLTPVPEGSVTLQLTAPGFQSLQLDADVVAGMNTVLANLTLVRARGSVRGNARLGGQSDHSLIRVSITVDGVPVTAFTSASGDYLIDDVPVGDHSLVAERSGFQPASTFVDVTANEVYDAAPLTLALDPGRISGRVQLVGRDDHSGVSVRRLAPGAVAVTTNADGDYLLPEVPTGTWTVRASAEGYQAADSIATVSAGEDTEAPLMRLLRATGDVAGVVELAGQSDHAGTLLILEGADYRAAAVTGPNGEFVFGRVPVGDYELRATHPGYLGTVRSLSLREDQRLDLLTEVLALDPGSVRGRVERSGDTTHDGIEIVIEGSGLPPLVTDAAGDWFAGDVPEGFYPVVARNPGFETARSVVAIEAGVESEVPELQLRPERGSLSGELSLSDGASPAGISVELTGISDIGREVGRITRPRATGAFSFEDVLVGTYDLRATRSGYLDYVRTGVRISAGQVLDIEEGTLELDPGTLTGTVRLEASESHAGVQLSIDAPGATPVLSDASGEFVFAALPAGTWQLEISAEDYVTQRRGVTVLAGKSRSAGVIVLPVQRGGLEGRVQLTGRPDATGAVIRVTAGDRTYSATTGGDGRWRLETIPVGTYSYTIELSGFETVTGTLSVFEDVVSTLPLTTLDTIPAPVSGVAHLEGLSPGTLAGTELTLSAPGVSPVTTDGDGAYLFTDAPAGVHTVTARREGYASASVVVTARSGETVTAPPLALQVARGSVRGELRLEGRDSHGGAVVTLEVGDEVLSTTSDDSGRFTLSGVPTGLRTLRLSAPGFAATTVPVEIAENFSADAGVTELALIPGVVAGQVTLEDSANSADILVTLSSGEQFTTGVAGDYSFNGVGAGVYTVTAAREGYEATSTTVGLEAGGAVTAPPLVLLRSRGAIEGTVELAGEATSEGAVVNLTSTSLSAVTGPDGAFLLTGVPVGTYELTISRQGFLRATRASLTVEPRITLSLPAITLVPQSGDFSIDEGAAFTASRDVTLAFSGTFAEMRFSEDPSFEGVDYEPFRANPVVTLGSEGDGVKTLYAQFIDADETASQVFSQSIVLDTAPPEALSVTIDGGAELTNSADGLVTIEIEASDATSGVTAMMVSVDGTWPASFVPFEGRLSLTLDAPTEDGERSVWVRVQDRAGNATSAELDAEEAPPAVDTITLDRTPPALTAFEVMGDGSFATSPFVNLRIASDDATLMALSNEEGFPVRAFEPFAPPSLERGWFLSADDGPKSIYLLLADAAGNVSEAFSAQVTLDQSPPSAPAVQVQGSGFENGADVTVELSVAGATEMRVDLAGQLAVAPWVALASAAEVTLPENDGVATVAAEFRDAAGNVSAQVSDTLVVDRTSPSSPRVTVEGGAEFTRDPGRQVALQLSAQDLGSGIASMRVATDGVVDDEPEIPFDVTLTRQLPSEGSNTVAVVFIDRAGNASSVATDEIVSDTEAPTLASFTIDSGAGVTANNEVLLAIDATGATEMRLSNQLDFTGASWEPLRSVRAWTLEAGDGDKTVYLRIRDAAGNLASGDATIDLDTTAPAEPVMTIVSGRVVNDRSISLDLSAVGASSMRIGTDAALSGTEPRAFATSATFELPNLDGDYTVFVRFDDAAGNASAVVSAPITLDRIAPTSPSVIVADGPLVRTRQITLNLGVLGATEMQLSTDGVLDTEPFEPLALARPVTLPSDGLHAVRVVFRDAAGNLSEEVSAEVTVDEDEPTAGATPVAINGGAALTRSQVVSLALDASGADEMLVANAASRTGGFWEPYAGARDWTLAAGADGLRQVFVWFRDAAGNEVGPLIGSIDLDTLAPGPVGLTIAGGAYVNDRVVQLTLVTGDASEMQLSAEPGFGDAEWVAVTSPATFTLPDADAAHSVHARFRDAAGNVSTPVSANTTLDRVAPLVASVSLDGGALWTRDAGGEVALLVSAQDELSGLASLTVAIDGALDGAGESPGAFQALQRIVLDAPESDGLKTVMTAVTDRAGNTSDPVAAEIFLDRAPPALVELTLGDGSGLTAQTPLPLTVEATGAAEMRLGTDASFAGSVWEPVQSPVLWPLNEGLNEVHLQLRDEAGNTNDAVSRDVTLDTVAPAQPTLDIDDGAFTAERQLSLSLSASGATEVELSTDPAFGTFTTIPYAPAAQFDIGAGDGTRTVYARFLDDAGNRSAVVSDSVTLDTEAPVDAAFSIVQGSVTRLRQIDLELAATGADEMIVAVDGTIDSEAWEAFAPSWTGVLPDAEVEHTVAVSFRDFAMNELATPLTRTITLDESAPLAPTLTAPNDGERTAAESLQLTWGTIDGIETYDVEVATSDAFTTILVESRVEAPAPAAEASLAVALGDGEYFWRVRGVDPAGNLGDDASPRSFVFDRTAPAIPVLVQPTGEILGAQRPTLTYSDESGSGAVLYAVEIDDDAAFEAPLVAEGTSSGASFTPSIDLPEQTLYFRVAAEDALGNRSAFQATPMVFTLDRTPPDAPTSLAVSPGSPMRRNTFTLSWDGNAEGYELQVAELADFAETARVLDEALTGELRVATLTEGTYFWRVRSRDAAGNRSTWTSAAAPFVIDNTAPPVPSMLELTEDPTADTQPVLSWTDEGAAGYRLELVDEAFFATGVGVRCVLAVSATSYDVGLAEPPCTALQPFGVLDDGRWRARVSSIDAAGNVSERSAELVFTVDTVAPQAPLTGSAASPTNDATPLLSWSVANEDADAASYELEVWDSPTFDGARVFEVATEDFSAVVSTPLDNGVVHGWRVRALDLAGNSSEWTIGNAMAIDLQAPTPPGLVAPCGGTLLGTQALTLSWSSAVDAVSNDVQVAADPAFEDVERLIEGVAANTEDLALDDGRWYWRGRSRDEAGNVSGWSSTCQLTVDTTPPDAPTPLQPAAGQRIGTDTPLLRWSDEGAESYRVTVFDNDVALAAIDDVSVGQTRLVLPSLPDGRDYTWEVVAVDAAENASAASARSAFEIDTTGPTVAGVVMTPEAETLTDRNPLFVWVPDVTDNAGDLSLGYRLEVWSEGALFASVDDIPTPTHRLYEVNLPDGDYRWRIAGVDDLGNIGAYSHDAVNAVEFTVDVTPPEAPSVLRPESRTYVNTFPLTVSWTVSPEAVSYKLVGTQISGGSGTYEDELTGGPLAAALTVVDLDDGEWGFRVTATDDAGNESQPGPFTVFTVDTEAPSAPPSLSAPRYTNDVTPALQWAPSAEAADYLVIIGTEEPLTGGITPVQQGVTTTSSFVPNPLTDGDYVWSVAARDAAGNVSAPQVSAAPVTVDTVPPSSPRFTPQTTDIVDLAGKADDPTVVAAADNVLTLCLAVESTDENFASYEVRGGHSAGDFEAISEFVPTTTVACPTDPALDAVTFRLLSDQQNLLQLRARDQAGNVSDADFYIVTEDSLAPVMPIIERAEVDGSDLLIRWTPSPSTDVVTYLVHYGNTPGRFNGAFSTSGPSPVAVTGTVEARLTDLPLGNEIYVNVTALDGAGHESPLGPTRSARLGEVNFRLLAELGFDAEHLALVGTELWVAAGPTVERFDISDADNPAEVGLLPLDLGTNEIGGLAADGEVAIIAQDGGYFVVDVSDPARPSTVARLEDTTYEVDEPAMLLAGDLLVVDTGASDAGVLKFFDMSTPALPRLIWERSREYWPLLAFDNDTLYIVDSTEPPDPAATLQILDPQLILDGDPGTSPILNTVAFQDIPGVEEASIAADEARGRSPLVVAYERLAITGSYALQWTGAIFDVSDPENVSAIATVQPAGTFGSVDGLDPVVFLSADEVFMWNAVYDLADTETPVATSAPGEELDLKRELIQTPGRLYAVVEYDSGDYAVRIFDTSDGEPPSLVSELERVEDLLDVKLSGGFAYVITSSALVILDVSNPYSPRRVGSAPLNRTFRSQLRGHELLLLGRETAFGSNNSLYRIDVSNPAEPQVTGPIVVDQDPPFIGQTISDWYILEDVAAFVFTDDFIQLHRITESGLTFLDSFDLPSGTYSGVELVRFVSGGIEEIHALVLEFDGLEIVDVTGPVLGNGKDMSSFTNTDVTGPNRSLAMIGDLLWLTGYDNVTSLVDLRHILENGAAGGPIVASLDSSTVYPSDFRAFGPYVITPGPLRVFDARDTTNIRQLATVDDCSALDIDGSLVACVESFDALRLYESASFAAADALSATPQAATDAGAATFDQRGAVLVEADVPRRMALAHETTPGLERFEAITNDLPLHPLHNADGYVYDLRSSFRVLDESNLRFSNASLTGDDDLLAAAMSYSGGGTKIVTTKGGTIRVYDAFDGAYPSECAVENHWVAFDNLVTFNWFGIPHVMVNRTAQTNIWIDRIDDLCGSGTGELSFNSVSVSLPRVTNAVAARPTDGSVADGVVYFGTFDGVRSCQWGCFGYPGFNCDAVGDGCCFPDQPYCQDEIAGAEVRNLKANQTHLFYEQSGDVRVRASTATGALEAADVHVFADASVIDVVGNDLVLAGAAAGGGQDIEIWDVSDMDDPQLEATIPVGNPYTPLTGEIQGEWLFIRTGGGGMLHVFDFSNPANPVLVGTRLEASGVSRLVGDAGLTVADGSGGGTVVYDAGPYTTKPIFQLSLSDENRSQAALLGSTLLTRVADELIGWRTTEQPARPAVRLTVGTSSNTLLDVQRGRTFVATDAGFEMYDTPGSSGWSLVASYTASTGTSTAGIKASGQRVYISRSPSDTVEIVDISNASGALGEAARLGIVEDVASGTIEVSPPHIFVGGVFIDATDPASPRLGSQLGIEQPSSLQGPTAIRNEGALLDLR